MKITLNRFDPAALTKRQLRELDRLSEAFLADERPALVGQEGVRVQLPEPIFHLLVQVVRTRREGKGIGVTWEIDLANHGGFHIWPVASGEGAFAEREEAAEAPVDAVGVNAARGGG
jgi:hypothetical protein